MILAILPDKKTLKIESMSVFMTSSKSDRLESTRDLHKRLLAAGIARDLHKRLPAVCHDMILTMFGTQQTQTISNGIPVFGIMEH